MSMINLLVQGLVAVGMRILIQHIKSDEDSKDVEKAIIEAKTPEEIQAVVKTELIEAIDREFMTDTEIPKEVVEGLANANSTEEIVNVLETESGKQTVLDGISSFLGGIINFCLRRK